MMNGFKYLLLVVLAAPAAAVAETAYVTDMLQLEMYATADMAGAPIQKLRSGDKMDVIARSGRTAQVRIGGQVGWVKSLYLVEKEPARTRVNQLESTNESLEDTNGKLRTELDALKETISNLEQAKSGEVEDRTATEQELERLRDVNQQLESNLATYTGSVPALWTLAAMAISLLGGGLAMWWWIDRRSRERHGGYRIY